MVDSGGTLVKGEYYYPYGGNRGSAFSALTTKRFTGQYHESGLPGGEGLSYYNARWYDAQLGRFVSADTFVPELGNPQDLNRMAYVRGNPLRFVDPTGYYIFEEGPGDPHHSLHQSGSSTVSIRSRPQGKWNQTNLPDWRYRRAQMQYNRYIARSDRYLNDTYAAQSGNISAAIQLTDGGLYSEYVLLQRLAIAISTPTRYVHPVDAIVFGVGVNADPNMILGPIGVSGTSGAEILVHENGEIALYTYGGGGGSLGTGANVKVYAGRIRNLDDVDSYSGWFEVTDATGSFGPLGGTSGRFSDPTSGNGPYGGFIGYAPGANLSVSESAVYYTTPFVKYNTNTGELSFPQIRKFIDEIGAFF